jgi:acyl-CoA reductase-like NAD-dependent aldehyde dehydrogenase
MVNHCVEVFRHYAGWPTRLYGQTAASVPGQFHYTVRQPLGVVAAICAWNGPLLQLSWKVAPALATGNTVVVKPSQQTPLTALRFAELLLATDLPPGVFNLVTGTGQTAGQALITHGTVWVNTFGEMTAGTLPFGGFKQSGIGREHGTDVIDAFTEIKTVIMNL